MARKNNDSVKSLNEINNPDLTAEGYEVGKLIKSFLTQGTVENSMGMASNLRLKCDVTSCSNAQIVEWIGANRKISIQALLRGRTPEWIEKQFDTEMDLATSLATGNLTKVDPIEALKAEMQKLNADGKIVEAKALRAKILKELEL